MDRFIEIPISFVEEQIKYLKSNMDRFIAKSYTQPSIFQNDLKSNMDRFIAIAKSVFACGAFI